MSNNITLEFPVVIYGNLEKFNETISKARCRIFYKYGNRNGTYITDEFAEKLLSTIPYSPVKGIYNGDENDYTDHGTSRDEGRIYGVVPENPNVAWEKHLDEDGVEREYACVDVLVFSALYKEAQEVLEKGQSMELYPPSIKGQWKVIDGRKQYVFEEGCFLGLQILGDEVEPCFEGAGFYSLASMYENFKKLFCKLEEQNLNLLNGGKKMLNFKLSDNAKFNAIWSLLNSNYNEENNWLIEYGICDIYDEYAVVRNYEANCFERVYYTKNDDEDTIVIDRKEQCYIVDVNEAEKNALKVLHELNGATYEKVDENLTATQEKLDKANETIETYNATIEANNATIADLEQKKSEEVQKFELKITELQDEVSTLNTEKDGYVSQLADAQIELNSLRKFKAEAEKCEKQAVIAKYQPLLDASIIETYTEKIGEYTCAKELDKDLAYELVNNNSTVFTKQEPGYIPQQQPLTGLEGILSKYKK